MESLSARPGRAMVAMKTALEAGKKTNPSVRAGYSFAEDRVQIDPEVWAQLAGFVKRRESINVSLKERIVARIRLDSGHRNETE